jgi:hypothetical protein
MPGVPLERRGLHCACTYVCAVCMDVIMYLCMYLCMYVQYVWRTVWHVSPLLSRTTTGPGGSEEAN